MSRQSESSALMVQQVDRSALVASVAAYPGSGKRRKYQQSQSWQHEVWGFYDLIGELRFGLSWIANVVSRASLYAALREGAALTKAEPGSAAAQAMEQLFRGPNGQSGMLKALGLHISAVGECYLISRAFDPEFDTAVQGNKDDVWEVVGTEEITVSGDAWSIKREDGRATKLTETDIVLRIWRPHPKNRELADSACRAALPVLREIRMYDMHIQAQTTSRLTGAGLMLVPSEIQFRANPDSPEGASSADSLTYTVGRAMETAIGEPGDASAQVPIVVTAPGEHLDKIKLLHFWSDLDEKVIEMRREAIRRLALSMDMPQEALLGTGDMNRWGAWQVEESSVKAHIEPLLDLIVSALTVGYLAHMLKADGVAEDQIMRSVVAHDTSVLRLRPNRSKEALELYDRGQLNAQALLRENGFSPEDAMDSTSEEFKSWLLRKVATASYNPEQAQAALEQMGVELGVETTDSEQREARPTPSLLEHPTQDKPDETVVDGTAPSQKEGLAASANNNPVAVALAMSCYRAMERAGNRLRSVTGQRDKASDVRPENVHLVIQPYADRVDDLLKDAWAPLQTMNLGPDMTASAQELADSYCRRLLSNRQPFSYIEAYHHLDRELRRADVH